MHCNKQTQSHSHDYQKKKKKINKQTHGNIILILKYISENMRD